MPVMANELPELEIHASNIMFVVNFCYSMIDDYAEEDLYFHHEGKMYTLM